MEGGIGQEVVRVLGLFNPLPTWIAFVLMFVLGRVTAKMGK